MGDVEIGILMNMQQRGFSTMRTLQTGFAGISAGAIAASAAIGAVLVAAKEMVDFLVFSAEAFTTWEEGIIRVKAVTGATEEEFAALQARSRELGETTVFTATEVTQAMFFMGQAGLSVTDILEGVDDTLALARIGMIDLGRASDIITDTMAAAGLGVEDFTRVVDVMTLTFTSANTSVDQLGTAFSKVGPVAANLGVEFEEVAAAIAVLSNAGLKGEEAGAALRNIFLRLLNPSADAEIALDKIGISARDVAQGMFDLEDIILALRAGMQEGAIDAADIAAIFQARATPAVLTLITSFDDGKKSLADFNDELEAAGGTAEEISEILDESAATKFKELKSIITEIAIEIGSELVPVLVEGVEWFKANKDEIGDLVENLKDFAPVLETTLALLNILLPVVIKLHEAISFVNDAISLVILSVFNLVSNLIWMVENVLQANGIIFVLGESVSWITDMFEAWGDAIDTVADGLGKIQGVGEGVSDFIGGVGEFVSPLLTENRLFGSQAGNRRITQTGVELVHEGEIITNPHLGQSPPGTGAGIQIGTIQNNFQVSGIDAFELERKQNRYLRRLQYFR